MIQARTKLTLILLATLGVPQLGVAQETGQASPPSAAQLEKEFTAAQRKWNQARREASRRKDTDESKRLRRSRPETAFIPRFREGATAYAGTEAAVPYLAWMVSRGNDDVARASIETLMRDHIESPGIKRAVARIGGKRKAFGIEQSRAWLDSVIAKNRHPAVQHQARYTRAAAYVGTRAVEQSEALRQLAIEDLSIVKKDCEQSSLRGLAERLLFEAENLEPGLPAPEITGEDLDGVAFKLSDYKGKVILLDFWGDW